MSLFVVESKVQLKKFKQTWGSALHSKITIEMVEEPGRERRGAW